MPALLLWLGELIATSVGAWAVSALVSLGIGFATYKVAVQPVEALIKSYFLSAGPMVGYIGFFGIDVSITIVFSAYLGRVAISSARAHLVRKG